MKWLGKISTWLIVEYLKEYREGRTRVFDTIIKNNLHLNTVILTVSVASLTAIAALNDKLFDSYSWLSITVVGLFILTILLSTINFFLSGLVLRDLQQKLNKDILFSIRISKDGYEPQFKKVQKILNVIVLSGFCLGLICFLALFGFYILGVNP